MSSEKEEDNKTVSIKHHSEQKENPESACSTKSKTVPHPDLAEPVVTGLMRDEYSWSEL